MYVLLHVGCVLWKLRVHVHVDSVHGSHLQSSVWIGRVRVRIHGTIDNSKKIARVRKHLRTILVHYPYDAA